MEQARRNIQREIVRLTAAAETRPMPTGVPGLVMIRGQVPPDQLTALYEPMIGLVVQGAKILSIGEKEFQLRDLSYFLLPLHLPVRGRVEQGSAGRSYVSLGLALNAGAIQSLLRDLPVEATPATEAVFGGCEADATFAEAWLRLLRLGDDPRDVAALAPVYEREILYRVLMGPQGGNLRQLAQRESSLTKISQAVGRLRERFSLPVDVASLAAESGMALTTFHRQFKKSTGLSPIQFQKRLRLLEARNLLAFEGLTVAEAAYRVGYESASQFNREYSRFFGVSPGKSVAAG